MRLRPGPLVALTLLAAGCGGSEAEELSATYCADLWNSRNNAERRAIAAEIERGRGPASGARAWVGASPERESTCLAILRAGRRERTFVEAKHEKAKQGEWSETAGDAGPREVPDWEANANATLREDGSLEAGG